MNFYLLADWPVEYQDDPQSRFVNERKHANIQKDGTFSVVPRMWGGITNPAELRAIADAAEKYGVPTVKVTGGQRIDLLGVKGSDLPYIWSDLNKAGLVSGHAYSKGLRTVKTCVGTDHCRFGTQDSTGLGVKLEKILWGSWTPHKLKLAVSGCPRNCAEATCKDIGVVCVDSGYQISIGGAAGMDVKETEAAGAGPDRGRGHRGRDGRHSSLSRGRQVFGPPVQMDGEGRPRLDQGNRGGPTSTTAARWLDALNSASPSTAKTHGPSRPKRPRALRHWPI